MSDKHRGNSEWHFDFGLCNQSGQGLIPYEQAKELLDTITAWADARGCGIGGGFREFAEAEKKPFKL